MRSIIDEIASAEEQAAQIRQQAAVAAREALAAAQEEADARLGDQAEAGRAALREAAQRAEREGSMLSQMVLAQGKEQAQAQCNAAKENLPQAVAYLIGRVVSTA